MRNLYLVLLFLMSPIWAQSENLTIQIEIIKNEIAWRDSQVVNVKHGVFKQSSQRYTWKLEEDSNYRLYLVAAPLMEVKGELTIYKDARLSPQQGTYLGLDYYYWTFMTFNERNVTLTLNIAGSITGSEYAVIMATGGRETPEGFARTRVRDNQGNVYELIANVVYRNGKEYYEKENYTIVSLCASSSGKLYMQTDTGAVLSKDGVVFKSKERRVVKMVSSYNDRVYLLCDDSVVLDKSGSIAYKRSGDDRVVDLLEEDGYVWIVALNGKRVSL